MVGFTFSPRALHASPATFVVPAKNASVFALHPSLLANSMVRVQFDASVYFAVTVLLPPATMVTDCDAGVSYPASALNFTVYVPAASVMVSPLEYVVPLRLHVALFGVSVTFSVPVVASFPFTTIW